MNAFTKILGGAAIAAAVSLAAPAYAAPVPFQTSFSVFGNATLTGTNNINTATAITFTAAPVIAQITSGFGGFAGANGQALTLNSLTFSTSAPVNLVFTWGSSQQYTFTGSSTAQLNTNTTSYAFNGNFTDSTGQFASQSADFAVSFTQSSAGNTVTYSGNFDSPNPIPEPISMVVLGTGLLGLAAARRRAL